MPTNTLEIYNETKTEIPNLNFLELKNQILGEKFELTISILLGKNSHRINKKQRKKDYIPNTLSFKYSENSGEIILTPEIIEVETYSLIVDQNEIEFQKYQDKFLYLLIHSLLHLKDMDHSVEMEKLEAKYFQVFSK